MWNLATQKENHCLGLVDTNKGNRNVFNIETPTYAYFHLNILPWKGSLRDKIGKQMHLEKLSPHWVAISAELHVFANVSSQGLAFYKGPNLICSNIMTNYPMVS